MQSTTLHLRSLALGIPLVGLGACTSPWDIPWEPLPTWDETSTGTDTETGTDTATGDDGGTTAASGETGESAGGTTGASSDSMTQGTESAGMTEGTGEPVAAPEILEVRLTPQPMLYQGAIAAEVEAIDASGVRLLVADAGAVELAGDAGDPTLFVGEIPALGGAMNGEHLALLTPWTTTPEGELVDGETVEVAYTLALPEPGSEVFWEAGDLIGIGQVVGLAHTLGGQVFEFGSHEVGGKTQCYLRRRSKGGAWAMQDFKAVLPGVVCEARGLAASPSGELFVLAHRETPQGVRWWLGRLPTWGSAPENMALGAPNEAAQDLALHSSGMVAVCGSVPTQGIDGQDAAAWLLRQDLPGEKRTFDYQPVEPNEFAETLLGCAFAGDTLAMAGEAYGRHGLEKDPRTRHLLLEFNTLTKAATWTVAGGDLHPQSAATAIAVDDGGRYVIGGYVCGASCNQPTADLRVYAPGGGLLWRAELGPIPHLAWAPGAVAWSPAGYAVVALPGIKGAEVAFSVRAYSMAQVDPLWVYNRQDHPFLHVATAVAVGVYGEIVAGGSGMSGYPAVAYIAG